MSIEQLLAEAKRRKTKTLKLEGVDYIQIKGDKGEDSDPAEVARILSNDKTFIQKLKGEDADPREVASFLLNNQYFLNAVKGKDGDSVLPLDVVKLLKKDKAFIESLKGEDGQDFTPDLEEIAINTINTLESFEGEDRLDAKAIKNLEDNINVDKLDLSNKQFHAKQVKGILDLLPKNPPMYGGGSGATFLKSLRDVNLTGLTLDAEGKYLLGSGSGGGGTWGSITGTITDQTDLTLQNITSIGATTTNSITALSFIKSGGTSSQFLKADGSVDSNTYLTSIGTGTTDTITYWSGSNTIGSLSTATYPSLTELSYVKGVSSAIQTQINAKFTLPTLTSGSVLFSNGTTIAQDNANFFWDDSNNRLGLGTATPSYQLSVNGTAATSGILVQTSDFTLIPNPGSVSSATLLNARGFNMTVDGATLGATYQPALGIGLAAARTSPLLSLKNNAAAPALLIEQGYFGIGVNAPRQAVDVTGSIVTSWADANRIGMDFQTGSQYRMGMAFSTGSRALYLDALSLDTSFIAFRVGTVAALNERARINSTGLGIGTTPSTPLHVLGVARVDNGATTGALNFGANVNSTTRSSNTRKLAVVISPDYANTRSIEWLTSDSDNSTTNRVYIGGRSGGSNYAATELHLTTAASVSTTGGTTALFINSSQNVGIGTTSPTAVLHLKAGTATANTAPLKFTTGTNLTTAEAGVMEYDNTPHFTNSDTTRRHIALAPNNTKVTAGAPYTNDGYIIINIGGTDFKVMTTA